MRAFLALIAVALTVTAAGAFQATDEVQCKRMLRRYQRECPSATPTPVPTPKPTTQPLPCEPIGGTKTFVVGRARLFCFTAEAGSTFVTIEATSPADVGCAYFKLSLTEPSGHQSYGEGSYPIKMSEEPRVAGGRYYFGVEPSWISDGRGCDTFTLTVR